MHAYKMVQLVGTSEKGIEDAVQNALLRAKESLRHMRWFTVEETRGDIRDGRIQHWQVRVAVGFTLEE
ncbi:MAG: dodecin [Myxococcota bacterium]|nr:dodecin [Myxococcota bacterium]